MKIITSELLEMSYDQLVKYYLKKYGKVKYDFFHTPTCVSVQKKNSRTKEGLQIHHIDEDKYPNLSQKEFALNCPFECQKANRLVYVNILEHLLLHIKIYQEEALRKIKKGQQPSLGKPGIRYLSKQINDYFSISSFNNWHENMASIIRNNFDDYIDVLMSYLTFISKVFPNYLFGVIEDSSKKTDNTLNDKVKKSLMSKSKNLFIMIAEKNNSQETLGNAIENENFDIGDKVFHETFGQGIVKEIQKYSIIKVEFEKVGEKAIIGGYGYLKKIEPKK